MLQANQTRHIIFLLLLLFFATNHMQAESKSSRAERKHEIRIGWGDQLFETLVWHEEPFSTIHPPTMELLYNEDFQYLQHWFIEYQFRHNHWFSYGGTIDYSGVLWDKVIRNGKGEEIKRTIGHNFMNIVIMPNIRFTYLYHKYVSLYSGIGVGMNINTGSELDYKQRKTAVAPAFNLTLLGLEVGLDHWFASFELGGLYSLVNTNEIYMASSRIMAATIGFRF